MKNKLKSSQLKHLSKKIVTTRVDRKAFYVLSNMSNKFVFVFNVFALFKNT